MEEKELRALWHLRVSSVAASVRRDFVRKVSRVFGLELIPKQERWLILELELCLPR